MPHPYESAPAYRKWRSAMAAPAPSAIDPVVHAKFRLSPTDRIVTAGSCFAQHIARWLKEHGHHFLVTEPAHPLLPADLAETYQYGIYTARTGNIYTARQLLQLLHRATGQLHPTDDIWQHNGAFFDPFRPAIQPGGFPTLREYRLDRARHLACVRQAFETMGVFIFTLGLTECWANRQDGTVYPVCPGTIAGTFDPAIHHLLNFSVTETVADLRAFISEIRAANPNLRVILTVSPVPLAATALDRHVLISTTYSKSVLRVAAEILAEDPAIQYFPSYEIITSPATSHTYFAPDLRSITQDGVDHVMRLFARHIASTDAPGPAPEHADHFANLQKAMATLCEDEALDP